MKVVTSILFAALSASAQEYGGKILKKCFDAQGQMYVCGSHQTEAAGARSSVPYISEEEEILVGNCMEKKARQFKELKNDQCPRDIYYCNPEMEPEVDPSVNSMWSRWRRKHAEAQDLKFDISSYYCQVSIVTGKEKPGSRYPCKDFKACREYDPFKW